MFVDLLYQADTSCPLSARPTIFTPSSTVLRQNAADQLRHPDQRMDLCDLMMETT
jgi:hypothetical protein